MIDAPKFLFVQINTACNLRCQHCFYWTQKEPAINERISLDRICELVKEFAELSPHGSVVICGGEPLLAEKDCLILCKTCRIIGLRSLLVTNGTTITDKNQSHKILEKGPDEITISLDSHLENIHDQMRGTKGSYQSAIQALRLLIESRKNTTLTERRINVMTLIHSKNCNNLDALYHLVLNDIKADKLKINLLQPSFGIESGSNDNFFIHHHRVDGSLLAKQLIACNYKYNLNLNPLWICQVEMYFKSINVETFNKIFDRYNAIPTIEHICNSGERNIMIDLTGIARLCFSPRFPGMKLNNPGDMKNFWESSNPIRQNMKNCNALCGISHSVRREHASL